MLKAINMMGSDIAGVHVPKMGTDVYDTVVDYRGVLPEEFAPDLKGLFFRGCAGRPVGKKDLGSKAAALDPNLTLPVLLPRLSLPWDATHLIFPRPVTDY